MTSAAKTRLHLVPSSDAEEMEAAHRDLRPKVLRPHVEVHRDALPPVEPVIKWTLRFHEEGKRPAMLVVPGHTAHDRAMWYTKYLAEEWATFRPDTIEDILGDQSRDWVDQTIIANVTHRIAMAKVPAEATRDLPNWAPPVSSWEFVWALATVTDFLVEEPLRGFVDQPHYLFHEVYRVLWELRFRVQENPKNLDPALEFFEAGIRWLTGSPLSTTDQAMLGAAGVTRRVVNDQERLDVLCFLLTLADHNALLNRYVFCFDGLERVLRPDRRALLRELTMFLGTLDRWIRLASAPIGVLIGMDTSSRQLASLRRLSPKLATEIEAGLAWTSARSA